MMQRWTLDSVFLVFGPSGSHLPWARLWLFAQTVPTLEGSASLPPLSSDQRTLIPCTRLIQVCRTSILIPIWLSTCSWLMVLSAWLIFLQTNFLLQISCCGVSDCSFAWFVPRPNEIYKRAQKFISDIKHTLRFVIDRTCLNISACKLFMMIAVILHLHIDYHVPQGFINNSSVKTWVVLNLPE